MKVVTITIFDEDHIDEAHLQECFKLIARQRFTTALVTVSPREPSGWLEYVVTGHYERGGSLTVGVIQREPGAEVECHS